MDQAREIRRRHPNDVYDIRDSIEGGPVAENAEFDVPSRSNSQDAANGAPRRDIGLGSPRRSEAGDFSEFPWSGRVRRFIYIDFTVYILLLIVFCVITLSATSKRSFDSYHIVQSVQSTLLQEFRPEPEVSFHNIVEFGGLRRWLSGPFMAVLYGFNPNDPGFGDNEAKPVANHLPGFYLASTTILGPIRLRQLRVKSNSCEIAKRWTESLPGFPCFSPYSRTASWFDDDESYSSAWFQYDNRTVLHEILYQELKTSVSLPEANTSLPTSGLPDFENFDLTSKVAPVGSQIKPDAQNFQQGMRVYDGLDDAESEAMQRVLTAFEFDGDTEGGPYRGRLNNIYWDYGFVADLPESNLPAAQHMLDLLTASKWLDAQTRALFVEFTLYLPSANVLLAARLIIEAHPTGTCFTDMSLEPVNLDVYSLDNRWQLAVQGIGCVVALSAMVWELWNTRNLHINHARRTSAAVLWMVVGVLLYLGIIVAAILHAFNVDKAQDLAFEAGKYLASHKLGYFVSIERSCWAVLSFVIWFRLLKFTSQLPKLGILGRTIGRVVPQVAVFFLISCVIFLAFAQCFFMAYYASVPGYQTYQQSIMSVLRFTVLDFDYDALSNENRLLTPILFSLLLLIVFFIWVNVMVAIISEVYTQECDRSLNISWDADFPSMVPNIIQPHNDITAMSRHMPILTCDGQEPTSAVSLLPARYNRVRFVPLRRFNHLVTMDVLGHMTALDHQGHSGPGSGNNSRQRRSHGLAQQSFHHSDNGDSASSAAPNLLQQHIGIYARLGSLKTGGQKAVPVEKRRRGNMELQALYFDKNYHNITTARIWWDEHKSMFDSRERLMSHAFSYIHVPIRAVARSVSTLPGGGSYLRSTVKENPGQYPPPHGLSGRSPLAQVDSLPHI